MTNRIRYAAPPRPRGTIAVRANAVRHLVSDKSASSVQRPHAGGFAQTRGGNWHRSENTTRFDDYYRKVGFEQRFLEGREWEDTRFYRELLRKFRDERDPGAHGAESAEELVETSCEFYDDLYESIRQRGYRTGHSGPNATAARGYRERLEVFVTIDAGGQIHMWDGRHRFIIAQLLDLTIPAHVVCRHERWQTLRDDVHRTGDPAGLPDDLRAHPDLRDVLD